METVQREIIKGVSYQQYLQDIQDYLQETNLENLTPEEAERYAFTQLNTYRMKRIDKTYQVSAPLRQALLAIREKQTWLVLTARWCGDSAQNIPHLVKMAEVNPKIEIQLFERDENLELMDRYLTNGARSIPKLIARDKEGKDLFIWGSRPKGAQQIVTESKAAGLTKKDWEEKLHTWYARNKGLELEQEVLSLIS